MPDAHHGLPNRRPSPPPSPVWVDSARHKPVLTGKYLVWTSEGPEILRIEEEFMEYSDGSIADWDEITHWAEVLPPIQ